jgi:CRISPR type III-A-associated RAMP protein Csm5
MQTNYLKLDIITPVHVGTGDQLDPMAYLLREEDQGIFCYLVDTSAWVSDHPDPEALSQVFSGDHIPRIRGFIAENLDPRVYGIRRMQVTNPAIQREYQAKLRDQGVANQLLIDPQLYIGLGVPLLPGSSLKGAIRTAVIDHLDNSRKLDLKGATKSRDRRAYDMQLEKYLGKIHDNVFKQLKLSDFEGWADSTLLVTATEIRRKEGGPTTPKSHAEVLPSMQLGTAEHAVLSGKLGIGDGHANGGESAALHLKDGESFDWNGLSELVNAYQRKRLRKELERFYSLPQFQGGKSAVQSVWNALENPKPGEMVLRVGHYSQIEYVTVENNAPFTRKGRDGKFLPYGTTRTLANGLYPFGWVRLSLLDEIEYRQSQIEQKHYNNSNFSRRDQQRQAIQKKLADELAEKLVKERQQEEKRLAEQRREAELAAMPENERRLYLLEQGKLIENEVVTLYAELDELEPNIQRRTAEALMTHWQKVGKWKKKQCSKKQLKKVAKIKTILGLP